MFVVALAYVGGVLTILSPCILPVVPFVLARSDRPFWRSTFPVLLGMAATFALLSAASVAGGHWIVQASKAGRIVALVVFAVLGLTLVSSRLAELFARPFVRLGNAVQGRAGAGKGPVSSLLVGASLGFLWAPCAGPILGLVLAGASLGSSARTLGLLFAFAMGAATALGAAALASAKLLSAARRALGAEVWIRRGMGVVVLGAVVAIVLHVDTAVLAAVPRVNTDNLEKHLVGRLPGSPAAAAQTTVALSDEGPAPEFEGATAWVNSPPLSIASLRGKVVLVDFWTYSCINCLRTLPHVKAWDEKYRDQGLVVVGVHTPEFAFEKDEGNVRKAVSELGVHYPVAIDNNDRIWSLYRNQYWPAHYFIDAKGRIRHHHFGEGNYEESERVIRELLAESRGDSRQDSEAVISAGTGVQAPPSEDVRSPETYIGYERQSAFASRRAVARDVPVRYHEPSRLGLNQWAAKGLWEFSAEKASLKAAGGELSFQFLARDVNLVLGAAPGMAVRYRVTIDGAPVGANHGEDTDADGNGVVKDHRLYQLVRVTQSDREHRIKIEFLDAGVEAFAFTFG